MMDTKADMQFGEPFFSLQVELREGGREILTLHPGSYVLRSPLVIPIQKGEGVHFRNICYSEACWDEVRRPKSRFLCWLVGFIERHSEQVVVSTRWGGGLKL